MWSIKGIKSGIQIFFLKKKIKLKNGNYNSPLENFIIITTHPYNTNMNIDIIKMSKRIYILWKIYNIINFNYY